MAQLFFLGILAGLDNLQVATAVGVLPLARARRMLLIAAFAVCEIATPLIGVFFASALQKRFNLSFEALGPFVVAACGVAIVWLALRGEELVKPLSNSRWLLIGLPISLSFDNLLIGVSASSLGQPLLLAALIIGITSAALCVTGILAGTRIARLIPRRAELVSGCALIVIAASMWIRG